MKASKPVAGDLLPDGAETENIVITNDGTANVHEGFDLLRVPGMRRRLLWGGFPYVFQAAMLAVFIALAVISWGVYEKIGEDRGRT